MTIQSGLLLVIAIMLTACDTRVHDPWVQDEDYLKAERTRSAQLSQQLDGRISGQRDR